MQAAVDSQLESLEKEHPNNHVAIGELSFILRKRLKSMKIRSKQFLAREAEKVGSRRKYACGGEMLGEREINWLNEELEFDERGRE